MGVPLSAGKGGKKMDPQEVKDCFKAVEELHNRFKKARGSFDKFLNWLGGCENDETNNFDPKKAEIENLKDEMIFRDHLDKLEGSRDTKQALLEFFREKQEEATVYNEYASKMKKCYIHANLFYQYVLDPEPIQQSPLALKKCKEIFPEEVASGLFPEKRMIKLVK